MGFQDMAECQAAWLATGESAGDNATDHSAKGVNDLIDSGDTQVARDATGGPFGDDAFDYRGAGDMRLLIANNDQVGLDLAFAQWSFCLWVKWDGAWPVALTAPVFVCKETTIGTDSYKLIYDFTPRTFVFTLNATGGAVQIASDGSHGASTWIHIAVTFDGSDLRMYVDGVEVSAGATAVTGSIVSNNDAFCMGNIADDNVASRMDGWLDEIAFFSKKLSPAEISQIYNLGLEGAGLALDVVRVDHRNMLMPATAEVLLISPEDESSTLIEPDIDNRNVLSPAISHREVLEAEIDA